MLIAGDFFIKEDNFKDYKSNLIFEDIQEIIERNEVRVLNLEAPILRPNTSYLKNPKVGPNLSMTEETLNLIKEKFNVCTLANNHIMDYCAEGIVDTISILSENGINYVGIIDDKENHAFKIFKVNDKNVGIINIAENEFLEDPRNNDIRVSNYDPIANFYLINELKKDVDFLVCIYHGGNEHIKLPSPEFVKRTRYLIDLGCDAVVCHHSHITSGFQVYNEKPIFFGLGNFVFDYNFKTPPHWNIGYLVELRFMDRLEFDIIPVKFDPVEKCVKIIKGQEKKSIMLGIDKIRRIVEDDIQLNQEFEKESNMKIQRYHGFLEVIGNKYYKRLAKYGLVPTILRRSKLLMYENLIRCETHRENILRFIRSKNSQL